MPDRILRFVVVGATGFCVDAGLTETLVFAGMSPFVARLFAFAVAIAVTYVLNRLFTFADRRHARRSTVVRLAESGRYLAVNLATMAVNYAVFAGVLAAEPGLRPVFAVAAGSGVAMVVSYFGYSRFVFRLACGGTVKSGPASQAACRPASAP